MSEMLEDWQLQAACGLARVDTEDFFPRKAEDQRAIAAAWCKGCVVKVECLAYALDTRTEHGVWGGRIERERRALLRRYPNITNWREIFAASLRNIEP